MLASPEAGIPASATPGVRLRRVLVPVLVLALIALVVAGVTSAGQQSQLIGSGSTLAQPLIERSARAFRNAASADGPEGAGRSGGDWVLDGSGISYEPVGSMGGIMRLSDPEVDFAVSDYPLSAEALAGQNLAQFPVAIGGVAVAYNLDLPGTSELRLDAPTLAAVYLGRITSWRDPAIARLNPGLRLPEAAITPVHRSDGSGSTFGFSSYLATSGPAWADGPGVGALLQWPTGPAVARSNGVISAIRQQPGSIGYVEPGQATRAGLPLATLRNTAGGFTAPTIAAMQKATADTDWSARRGYTDLRISSSDVAAYPITVAVYAVLKRDPRYRRDVTRTLSYLSFLLDRFDASATELGFAPLPPPAVQAVRDSWPSTLGTTP